MADAKSFLGLYHIVWGYKGPTVKFVIVIAIVQVIENLIEGNLNRIDRSELRQRRLVLSLIN